MPSTEVFHIHRSPGAASSAPSTGAGELAQWGEIGKRDWTEFEPGTVFSCEVWLREEEEGGYSVEAPRLPGAFSQGEDVAEALRMISDAIVELLRSYREDERRIPWLEETPTPDENDRIETHWVVVRP